MATVLTSEPTKFRAGDTVEWTITDSDYPASAGWTCKAPFAGPDSFIVESTADGDSFAFTIPSSESASITAGTYWAYHYFEKDGERHSSDKTVCEILADLSAVTGDYDDRTYEQQMLPLVEAAIKDLANQTVASMTVGGETYQYTDLDKLRRWRNQLRRAINKQTGKSNKIKFKL